MMKLPIQLSMSSSPDSLHEEHLFPILRKTHHDLARARLTDARVRLHIALFIRLELLDSEDITFFRRKIAWPHT